MQHADPTEYGDESIGHRSNVGSNRHVYGDRFADAALGLDDALRLDGSVEIDVGGENYCPIATEERR